MLITTTELIPGKNFEVLGMVKGNVVRAKHFGKDILAGLKSIVGGELTVYTELMVEARKVATERMVEDAVSMKADAIVCVRYQTVPVMDGSCEVMAYGTAVKFV